MHYAFNETRYFPVLFVLPGIGLAPVVVEVSLHSAHLLARSLLRILLHAGIYGSKYLQSARVQVISVVVTPVFQLVGHRFPEVGCLSVIVALHVVVEKYRLCLKRIECRTVQIAVLHHVAQHSVAAAQTVLWINAWVIVGCGLEHTHENGRLVGGHVLWRCAEVCVAGRFHAVSIRTEVHRVGVHGQDFLLVEQHFNLNGGNPLLALHYQHLHTGDIAEQTCGVLCADPEHILHQLLRYR